MITRVEIQDFRCLRHVDVPLKPLTVLVGPNDSGKSAFVAAVLRAVRGIGLEHSDAWRRDPNAVVRCEVFQRGEAGGAWVGRGPKGQTHGRPPSVESILPAAFHVLPSSGIEMSGPGHPDHAGPPPVGSNGAGIPALIDYLLRRDRKRFATCVEAARQLIPGLEEIEISTPDASTRQLDIVIEGGLRIPAGDASNGVRLILFFLSLAYHPTPPRLILLEEPENGVHPKRLVDVVKLLRALTQGVHGDHPAQVILTTHSPYLLDLLDLSTDQVLVFRREDDGSRSAQPADAARLATFLHEFLLGEVWFNQGEEGLVARR
jgi:predicted ATPase